MARSIADAALAVDLRAGNLIVSWGVADGINPMNVVNPERGASAGSGASAAASALSALDAGGIARRPVPAVEATYYAGDGVSAVTGVLLLYYVPAPLPAELGQAAPAVGGTSDACLDDIEFALRAETMLGSYNLYASYFRGRQDLPAAWMEGDELHLAYRRMHHVGLAAAGSIGDAAAWVEAGAAIPDAIPELETGMEKITQMRSKGVQLQVVAARYTRCGARLFIVRAYTIANRRCSLRIPRIPRLAQAFRLSQRSGIHLPMKHSLQLCRGRRDEQGVLLMPTYTFTVMPAVELSLSAVGGWAAGCRRRRRWIPTDAPHRLRQRPASPPVSRRVSDPCDNGPGGDGVKDHHLPGPVWLLSRLRCITVLPDGYAAAALSLLGSVTSRAVGHVGLSTLPSRRGFLVGDVAVWPSAEGLHISPVRRSVVALKNSQADNAVLSIVVISPPLM